MGLFANDVYQKMKFSDPHNKIIVQKMILCIIMQMSSFNYKFASIAAIGGFARSCGIRIQRIGLQTRSFCKNQINKGIEMSKEKGVHLAWKKEFCGMSSKSYME